jgi:hypothetical protein
MWESIGAALVIIGPLVIGTGGVLKARAAGRKAEEYQNRFLQERNAMNVALSQNEALQAELTEVRSVLMAFCACELHDRAGGESGGGTTTTNYTTVNNYFSESDFDEMEPVETQFDGTLFPKGIQA